MIKHVVARTEDIPDGGRIVVDVRGISIGVFNINGTYRAVLNRCPHGGAPLCEGQVLSDLTAKEPGDWSFDPSRCLLKCPWHGWEFDLATGESYFDPRGVKVRSYPAQSESGASLNREIESGGARDPEKDRVTGRERMPEPNGVPLVKGPYTAELIPVSVEGDYVVISMRS